MTGQNLMTCTLLPRNSGFAGSSSLGFFQSRGEFIACQDSDDISHLERIERQVRFLKENTDIQL